LLPFSSVKLAYWKEYAMHGARFVFGAGLGLGIGSEWNGRQEECTPLNDLVVSLFANCSSRCARFGAGPASRSQAELLLKR
jgi:hypothetical protein